MRLYDPMQRYLYLENDLGQFHLNTCVTILLNYFISFHIHVHFFKKKPFQLKTNNRLRQHKQYKEKFLRFKQNQLN